MNCSRHSQQKGRAQYAGRQNHPHSVSSIRRSAASVALPVVLQDMESLAATGSGPHSAVRRVERVTRIPTQAGGRAGTGRVLPLTAIMPSWPRKCSTAAAMLLEARHDLDEIAGAVPVVELPLEDPVPAVFARTR